MNNKLSTLYTTICALSPLLMIYSFTYSSFTVLDTLIVLFYIISLPHQVISNCFRIHPVFIWIFLYVIFHAFVDYSGNGDTKILLRAMHLANYIFFLTLYNRSYFDTELAIKIVRNVSVVSTFYLFFQHVVNALIGLPIPGQLPWFQVDAEYRLGGVVEMDLVRFASFFLEPSQYAMYILAALTLELFYRETVNKYVVLILCIGATVSTSNTALAGMALMLFLYIRKRGISIKMIAFLVISLLVVWFTAHTFVEAIFLRVGDGSSFENRFNGYNQIQTLLSANPIWGIGFWSTEDMGDDYLPGWARLYVYFGLIGILFYAITYFALYRRVSNKMMFLLALFFNFGGDTLFSVFFLFYSCFFVLKSDDRGKRLTA